MAFNLDIVNILVILIDILTFALGLFIYLTKRDSKVNLNFFIFTLAASFWCTSMFLYRGVISDDLSFLFSRILYVSAATIPYTFLFFIGIFPIDKYSISRKYLYVLGLPFLYVCTISFLPNYLILSSYSSGYGEKIIDFNTFYHTIYATYIITYFSTCYALLLIKYIKFSGLDKIRITYVIFGTFTSTIIGVSTNLIMPYLGDFSLNWAGQIGIIVMVVSISYSMMRHQLFDMKVIATQFIVFVLNTALFTRVLFSSSRSDLVINLVFLTITVIVSILLLASVMNEVRQREKLESLTKDLEKANAEQTSLIHFITHQVKGFLTKSRDVFSLFLEEDYGPLPEYLKMPTKEGFDSDTKGVATVQEILKASNLRKGTIDYNMQPVDLKVILEEVLNDQKKNIESKGLALETNISDGDYKITGDSEQLEHVLRNLIDNSVKYTPSGKISVSLSGDNEKVIFSVKDTGVGVSPEDKPVIFNEGVRGKDSLKVNVESTGYGLFIAKKIIDAHNAIIRVESDGVGKGSTFSVEFKK